MVVIQLQNNNPNKRPSLWIHSPIAIDESLVNALDALGHVEHIVSPNYEHVKYAKMWNDYYPNAKMWGCPGLSDLESNVNWYGEIPYGIRPDGDNLPNGFWNINELQPIHGKGYYIYYNSFVHSHDICIGV